MVSNSAYKTIAIDSYQRDYSKRDSYELFFLKNAIYAIFPLMAIGIYGIVLKSFDQLKILENNNINKNQQESSKAISNEKELDIFYKIFSNENQDETLPSDIIFSKFENTSETLSPDIWFHSVLKSFSFSTYLICFVVLSKCFEQCKYYPAPTFEPHNM